MTEIAKSLVGCVESCRQRYGINVILDTVHGANTAKIRSYRMDENPFYGGCAKVPSPRLRQVLNHLLIHNYLAMTDDEYAVVKLTEKSDEILTGGEAVVMKLAKEQPHPAKAEKGKGGRRKISYGASGTGAGSAELSPAEEALFERLRTLRTEIARGEKE